MEQERVRTDVEAASRWMTKAELATARGISVESADRLIRRQGWRKVPGNDGRARVLVPLSELRTFEQPRAPTALRTRPRLPPRTIHRLSISQRRRLRRCASRSGGSASGQTVPKPTVIGSPPGSRRPKHLSRLSRHARRPPRAARDRAEGRADRLTTAAAQTEAGIAGSAPAPTGPRRRSPASFSAPTYCATSSTPCATTSTWPGRPPPRPPRRSGRPMPSERRGGASAASWPHGGASSRWHTRRAWLQWRA